MNRLENFLSKHWPVFPACLMAILFIYYYTLHSGIGISPDSVVYASVADALKARLAAVDFNGMPMVEFPLGYPVLLALLSLLTKTAVLKLAPVLNTILFCTVILLTNAVLNRYTNRSWLYKLALLLLLACSPCLLEVYAMLWSETLFIVLTLLFLLLAHHYLRTPGMRNLLWMGLCCSVALVTRYAGITLVITGGLLILFHGETGIKQKTRHLLLFGFTGILLAVLNLLRNHAVRGSLTGVRERALRSFWENLNGMGAVFAAWFPFPAGNEKAALLAVVVLLVASFCFILFRLLQQQFYTGIGTAVACFGFVYLFFMLFISSVSRFEELSSRLLSPAYVPILLMGTHWLVPFIQNRLRKWQPWLLSVTLVLYGLLIFHQYQLNAEGWEGIKDAGMPGYTEDSWTQSPTITYLKTQHTGFAYPVYANANDAMYFLTGLYARPLPHKEIGAETDQLLHTPSFYLVWFNDGANDDLVGLDYIRQHRQILSEHVFADGTIYLFAPVNK